MPVYYGNKLISEMTMGTLNASSSPITLATPVLSIDTTTGIVTSTVNQTTSGYLTASSKSNTLSIPTQSGGTITPSATSQTAVLAGRYTLGAITVAPVSTETKTISTNGTYTPSNGKFFSSVTVNVPVGSTINNQDKTVMPSTSTQQITFDSGYTGLGTVTIDAIQIETKTATPSTSSQSITPSSGKYLTSVTVNPIPSNYIVPSGNYAITSNGTNINIAQYATVSVNVPSSGSTINNQNKTVTPTESQQSVSADSGYTGLGTVTVNAISSTYVGSGITTRNSNSLTVNGGTVSAPAGYYASAASKSVATMTLPTAAAASASGTSRATITPSAAAQYINIPTGYNGTASYYKIDAIPSNYIIPSGNKAITANGTNIDVAQYATVSVNVTVDGESWIVKSSENLHDSTEDVANTYINGSTETSYNGWTSTGFIPVEPDSYYLIQGTPGNNFNAFYTSTKTAAASSVVIPASPNSGTAFVLIKTNANTYYIRLSGASSGVADYKIYKAANRIPSGNKSITANGNDINVSAYDTVSVNVPSSGTTINNQNKTVTPSTSVQSITADSGYTGLGTVTVNAMPSGSATPPATISGTSATVTTGTNTLTLTQTLSLTPQVTAGYISSGTAANRSVSLRANVTTKAAATITPGTSNQTIASGTYLTGAQTIAGDTDLVAGNIRSGVNIFGVTGTYSGLDTSDANATAADINSGKTAYVNGSKVTGTQTFSTIHTGSSAPSNSLGANGDVYLVLV